MTGSGCGFNRSMQHLDSHRRAEEVAYEVPDEDPVHRGRQSLDVGALATGRVAARDRSAIRSLPCFDWRHPVENRRYTSLATASLSVGAGALGRAPSTVSREIGRNGGWRRYRASEADASAWQRASRPKRCKLAPNRVLARLVAEKLRFQWSPFQVAGWLKRTYPQDETRQVSHETIYRTLFIQARGALKKELLEHLRRTRVMRRSRHHTQKTADHGRITQTVSIRERPAEDRAVP